MLDIRITGGRVIDGAGEVYAWAWIFPEIPSQNPQLKSMTNSTNLNGYLDLP